MQEQIGDNSQTEVMGLDVERKEAEIYTASQWKLMWWKFRKHRLARWSSIVIITFYLVATFCEFLAPYTLKQRETSYAYAPPQRIRFVSEGEFHFRPFVYGLKGEHHPQMLRKYYVEDRNQRYSIHLFVRGETYRLWGLFRTNLHLFGVEKGGTLFLLGADSMGRDMLSRIIYGSRISLTIGLVGVGLSFVLGLLIGQSPVITEDGLIT